MSTSSGSSSSSCDATVSCVSSHRRLVPASCRPRRHAAARPDMLIGARRDRSRSRRRRRRRSQPLPSVGHHRSNSASTVVVGFRRVTATPPNRLVRRRLRPNVVVDARRRPAATVAHRRESHQRDQYKHRDDGQQPPPVPRDTTSCRWCPRLADWRAGPSVASCPGTCRPASSDARFDGSVLKLVLGSVPGDDAAAESLRDDVAVLGLIGHRRAERALCAAEFLPTRRSSRRAR